MNSNYGKSSNPQRGSSVSLNNLDFDLGIGSNRPISLNDQKKHNSSQSYSYTSVQSNPRPAWQPNKPSWTHQPAPSQAARPGVPAGPTSMVGDIFGKSWGSTQPSGTTSKIGISDKNPNLFGDLLTSALGQGSKSSGVPLKNVTPQSNKSSFSMGSMADSLPKTSDLNNSSAIWGSSGSFGSYNIGINSNKSPNLGGPSMRSMNAGGGVGLGMSSSRDPFGSLFDFGSKQSNSLNSASKVETNCNNSRGNDNVGDFQSASNPSTTTFTSSNFTSNLNDFGIPSQKPATQSQNPAQTLADDPLGMFFSSSSTPVGNSGVASDGLGGQKSSEVDDWGLDSEFGGGSHDAVGTTTELEGLPPPPSGVSASTAKNKGMDSYKQGQFADAIKWLSWAVILLEKAGDNAGTVEVLSSRASCYKEVGEYKKAVADCSKVLAFDDKNVSVLVQRALLYESMEKYRLGAEDLRSVLKIDPGNRIARSTVHRLTKLAD